MTKRSAIVRKLEKEGFSRIGGANHDKFAHPDGRIAIVPRHREIKDILAKAIFRQAGIE